MIHHQKQSISKIFALLAVVLAGCTTSENALTETRYASDRGKQLIAEKAMVSSAHPLASEAGLRMLEDGGNAVDAAVATAFALNVVEPNMSGIGGGGSMLIWMRENQSADYVDFYTAKRAETYRNMDYSQVEDDEFNLLSTGIPGTVDGLLQVLERHGTMTREEVMAPAIEYATEGFPVYLTLAQFIRDNEEKLTRYEGARNTFWPGGESLQVGEVLRQPLLAGTLQKISDGGASAFYEGEIAENMVRVFNEGGNPVSVKDFSEYEPQWNKAPLCSTYKNYTVLSAPLPQTGVYIIQALNILENYNLKELGLPTVSSKAFDILSSTMRLSLADRAEYITDPNWEDIPVGRLISKEYADMRRNRVGTGTVPEEMAYGVPSGSISAAIPGCENMIPAQQTVQYDAENSSRTSRFAANGSITANSSGRYEYETEEGGETTHISVVDPDGNAVSFSTTLSSVFGSGAWTDGFILNNSGFNFSNMEEDEWNGKHPYRIRASTISPTIILDDNDVRLVIGAPGGGRIPTAVLQNIVYILDYGLEPIDAIKMPRIFPDSRNPNVQVEKGFDTHVLMEARNMGYDVQTLSQGYARLYLVSKQNGKLIGVSDTRHDGEPRGF